MEIRQVNENFLKRANIGWCKKEGDKKGMDGTHVAMEMTLEPRMTFDPRNLHKPNIILLQQVTEQYVWLV